MCPPGWQAAIEAQAAEIGMSALGLLGPSPPLRRGHALPRRGRSPHRRALRGRRPALRPWRAGCGGGDDPDRLDELVANSDENQQLVHQLETHVDQSEPDPEDGGIELRSGDELAAEFERFLRRSRTTRCDDRGRCPWRDGVGGPRVR